MASDLQALITGVITGLLSRPDLQINISVAQVRDKAGNYLPKIVVRGNNSGDVVVISVEDLDLP